jgi:hypothetical protein
LLQVARALSIVAIAGWLTSLLLPALSFRFDGEHDQVLEGYKVLWSGYLHLLVLEFSWLANFVFWFVIWRLWNWPNRKRPLLIGGTLLVLLTAQTAEIFIWNRFFQYPKPYSGFYVWVASNVLLAISALTVARQRDTAVP